MGLRIRTNVASQEAQKNLRAAGSKQRDVYAQLSSGKRITKSADDAAGMAIANSLQAQVKGLQQAKRNANDGISLIQVAEGGLNETNNILTRMRELTIQAASDTVGEREREYLNREYQQLVSEMERIAQSTTFNGTYLLKGQNETGTLDFHVGNQSGDQNKVKWDSTEADATASTLGVDGTNIVDKDGANGAIENIDKAIQTVSSYRATMGAIQSRLQTTINNLEVQIVNQDNARSQIEDVDVAEASADLASININQNASVAILAQANTIPLAATRLIN
jgi:flagellin